ncbi:MAG: cytochrome c3 family protein [Draconibacterium sp.]|nr:cytochrome c3 family protein [Draconibacterium sp.]
MKSMKLLFTLLFVAAIATVGFGQGIYGSAHDFSTKNWNTSGEICIVCHTPHGADVTVADAPLWNHQLTSATFTVYTSSTIDATMGQPGASSKLCLSCHDGTVAVDNYGGTTNGSVIVSGGDLIGTDLRSEHPISFTYDDALATADGELFAPTTANSGLGSTIDADLLIGGKMECASCHDVHDAAGNSKLLVISNAASALCLTCHNK